MRKLIKVTRKHIKEGRRANGESCPVGLALKDFDPGFEWWVWRNGLDWDDKFLSPRSVKRFIRAFDHGKPVKPFSFYLNERYDNG